MSSVTNFVFACDESGGKGFSDVPEKYDGEVGVFAGILLRGDKVDEARKQLQEVHDRYAPSEGKYHIADLVNGVQEELRKAVFEVIIKNEINCFWHAIHVQGFHKWHTEQTANFNTMLAEFDDGTPKRIKTGSPRDKLESLHVHLFTGLYSAVVAYLEEAECTKVGIEIRSDNIDSTIVKDFEESKERLLSDDPMVVTKKGFDTVTKELVERTMTISTLLPEEYDLNIEIEKSTIDTTGKDDPLVLAADVLANSLHYYFKTRGPNEKYRSLNSVSAVKHHPLRQLLHSTSVDDYSCLSDQIYRHPSVPDFPNNIQ